MAAKIRLPLWVASVQVGSSLVFRMTVLMTIAALKFKVVLDMHITGLPKSYGGAVTANDAECPFELSQNAA